MKLIINIPDDQYKQMMDGSVYNIGVMINAIQSGISLDYVKDEIDQLPLVLFAGCDQIEKESVMMILDNIDRK